MRRRRGSRCSGRRGRGRARLRVALPLAIAVLAGCAAIARADGDPASDFLVARQVFLSSQSAVLSSAQRELLGVVASANRAGFAIRVAVISSEYDMGSITALWRKPQIYARFLGLELAPGYRGRLLVVMPNGFGFNWPGHPARPPTGCWRDVRVVAGVRAMAQAAQTAVTAARAQPMASRWAHRRHRTMLARSIGAAARRSGLPLPPGSRSRSSSRLLVLAAVRRRRERAHARPSARPRVARGCRASGGSFPRSPRCGWLRSARRSLRSPRCGIRARRSASRPGRWSRRRRSHGRRGAARRRVSCCAISTVGRSRSRRSAGGR